MQFGLKFLLAGCHAERFRAGLRLVVEPAPLEGLDGEGQRMGGDPQEPDLLLAAFLRDPPEASDPFRLRLGDELAGAGGGG